MKNYESVIELALRPYDMYYLPKRAASATRFEEHYISLMPSVIQNSSFFRHFEDSLDNADMMIRFGKLLAKLHPGKVDSERVDFMAKVGSSFASKTYEELKSRLTANKCSMIEAMIATSTFLAIRPTGIVERVQSVEEKRQAEKSRVRKDRLERLFRDARKELDRLNYRLKNDQHLKDICMESVRLAMIEWKAMTGTEWDRPIETPWDSIAIEIPKSKDRFKDAAAIEF